MSWSAVKLTGKIWLKAVHRCSRSQSSGSPSAVAERT